MTTVASDNYQATTTAEHPKKVLTRKNKRSQIVKICIIALVTALSVIFTVMDVVVTAQKLKQKKELKRNIAEGIKVSSIIHNLQNERSQTSLFLVSMAWNTTKNELKLQKIRQITDESIHLLMHWRYALPGGTRGKTISNSASFLDEIHSFRSKTDTGGEVMVNDHIHVFSRWIHDLILWLAHYTVEQEIENHADDLFAYQMIVNSKEELELEKTFGAMYYLYGRNFTFQNITSYNEKRVRAQAFLQTALLFSSVVKKNHRSLIKEMNASMWLENIESKRQYLISGGWTNSSKKDAMEWFDLMTKYCDLVLRLEISDANRIKSHVDEVTNRTILWLIIRSLLVCFAVIAVPFIIISLVRVQNEFYKYTNSLYHKVGLEQSRTDFLMRENARHVEDLAARWKQYSQTNSESQFPVRTVQPDVQN